MGKKLESNKLLFRGAFIREFTKVVAEDSRHTQIAFTSSWTDVVADALMGWDEARFREALNGLGNVPLLRKLNANAIIVTPKIAKNEFQIPVDGVGHFVVVPLKDKSGEITGRELRFVVTSTNNRACEILENHVEVNGRDIVQLCVNYSSQEEIDSENDVKPENIEAAALRVAKNLGKLGGNQLPLDDTLKGPALAERVAKKTN